MRIGKRAATVFCSIILFAGGCATTPTHLNASAKIPILAWYGVPQAQSTVERFREMADAGFTLDYSGYTDVAHARTALDAAQQAGVKLYPTLAALQTDPAATANALKSHPALAGYFLTDEPSALMFPELAQWKHKLQQADPNHDSYINLFPTYGSSMLGVPTYQDYLDHFLKTLSPAFISFDSYPIMEDGKQYKLRADWYQNLELVSATAKKAGIPFWAFALSTHHWAYPTPTLAHLRLQMFSNLAYGAQTLQYFTYWQSTEKMFVNAPIDLNGHRTPVYDTVKQMNREIQGLSPVFAGSQVLDVGHTGNLPAGTHAYQAAGPIESVSSSGSGVLVSTIQHQRRFFLVIVNRDVNSPQTLTIKWKHTAMSGPITRVMKDASLQRLPGMQFTTILDPGDIAVLSWLGPR